MEVGVVVFGGGGVGVVVERCGRGIASFSPLFW